MTSGPVGGAGGACDARTVAAIGEQPLVSGFALAGAEVFEVCDVEGARAAWAALSPTVSVVVLTPAAARALQAERTGPDAPLTVVMP